ncbi:hypothetical protein CVS40_4899 [Lucilia cuprina]|nr:hypothetical protein CVS40_4899 [Lucilia cuprina]
MAANYKVYANCQIFIMDFDSQRISKSIYKKLSTVLSCAPTLIRFLKILLLYFCVYFKNAANRPCFHKC